MYGCTAMQNEMIYAHRQQKFFVIQSVKSVKGAIRFHIQLPTFNQVNRSAGMKKEIRSVIRNCTKCQTLNVHQHNKAQLQLYKQTKEKFEYLNIDLKGPLTSSKNYRYCLTIKDQFARWTEALPLTNIKGKTIAFALISEWISCYTVPLEITTDLVSNFLRVESNAGHKTFTNNSFSSAGKRHDRALPLNSQSWSKMA